MPPKTLEFTLDPGGPCVGGGELGGVILSGTVVLVGVATDVT